VSKRERERGRGRRSVAASPDNLPRFSARCRRFVLLLGPPPDSFVPTRVPSPFPFPLFSAWDTRSLHPGCEVAGRRRSCDWKNLTRGIKKKGRSGRRDSGVVQIRPDAGKMHSFSSFSFFFLFLRIFLRARAAGERECCVLVRAIAIVIEPPAALPATLRRRIYDWRLKTEWQSRASLAGRSRAVLPAPSPRESEPRARVKE